jgi:hypothetical protein
MKSAKTSPRTLATKELAPKSNAPSNTSFFTKECFNQKQHDCHLPPILNFYFPDWR